MAGKPYNLTLSANHNQENIQRLENPNAETDGPGMAHQEERYSGSLRNGSSGSSAAHEEEKKGFFQRLFGKKRP